MGGHSRCLRSRPVSVCRNGAQPGREHRRPESPSAAAVCCVAQRRALRKAQCRSDSSVAGDGPRAIAPQRCDPQDAGPPGPRRTSALCGPLQFSAER
ncbi:hypothetical protein NDU88_004598 [Pleurodeles waltl]|uniref:Uncharacterized protein n=1 Tax=Pleurodeles waltl TaxID=8319 RepID=A0AAV7WA74_PLEWA|nr:hypothetical protein NDU88_004598 [Pleurodeles waltl]